jgi:hypothetical protein
MMPTESQIIERIHLIDKQQEVDGNRVRTLEAETDLLRRAVDKIRDTVGTIRVQVAGIVAAGSIIQILVTAFVVYKITKGA